MKITIEGEPKEIAALELALKDGGRNVTTHDNVENLYLRARRASLYHPRESNSPP